jgi:hypothetical protein
MRVTPAMAGGRQAGDSMKRTPVVLIAVGLVLVIGAGHHSVWASSPWTSGQSTTSIQLTGEEVPPDVSDNGQEIGRHVLESCASGDSSCSKTDDRLAEIVVGAGIVAVILMAMARRGVAH